MASKKLECAECGPGAIYHRLTYITVAIDELIRPLLAPGPLLRYFARGVHMIESRLTPVILGALLTLGIAKRIDRPDDHTMLLALMLWQEAEVRGIEMFEYRLFNLPRNIFFATFKNGKKIAFEGIPLPARGIEQAYWMDNKAELKKRFKKFGFPVAAGGAALTLSGARRIYSKLTPPVIIKPYSGSGSRHTTLHIDTNEELERGFRIATQVAPLAVIEEELVGPVYRATVVDGVLAAVLRRDPPHVIGDGTHTITELVEEANKNPKRSGPYFSKMTLEPINQQELAWQGYTPESVVEAGKRVTLHQKVNWSLGGTTADVTDEVHPDNRELFEAVAKKLRAPIVGIDFIISDMRKSWKEEKRSGILECNSMPFFDNHHLPFEGEVRNVAAKIWDMVEPVQKV